MTCARVLGRFRRSGAGNVAVFFGLALLPILLGVGAAVDFSRGSSTRQQMQIGLDAAVLAGINEPLGSRDRTAGIAFDGNLGHFRPVNIQRSFVTNIDGSYAGTASADVASTFLAVVGIDRMPLRVTATAQVPYSPTGLCLIALDPSSKKSLKITGNGSVLGPTCKTQVNSNDGRSVHVTGNGVLATAENCFVGDVKENGNGSIRPTSNATCPVWNDPFPTYPKPPVGACNYTNYQVPSGVVTLQPGTYCGGLDFKSGHVVTLAPGLYIVKDGPLSTSGAAILTGDGVSFYLTGKNSGFRAGGLSAWHITAMRSGPLAGFVVYLDPSGGGSSSDLSGSSSLYLEGVVYLPGQDLKMSGQTAAFIPAPFTSFIANSFEFTGQSNFTILSDGSKTTVPIPAALLTRSPGPSRLVK